MTLDDILKYYKLSFYKELAVKINLSPASVYNWGRPNKCVPYKWQKHFYKKTRGKLTIDPNLQQPNKGGRPRKNTAIDN